VISQPTQSALALTCTASPVPLYGVLRPALGAPCCVAAKYLKPLTLLIVSPYIAASGLSNWNYFVTFLGALRCPQRSQVLNLTARGLSGFMVNLMFTSVKPQLIEYLTCT
jgi:hypothetical protein